MRMTMLSAMTAIVGGMLLAACRVPGTAPASRVIEPMVPPVACAEPTTRTRPATGASIVSETSFAQSGLTWRECDVSVGAHTDWRQAEACFGQVRPSWSEEDEHRFGTRASGGLRLAVGDDVYEVRDHDLNVIRWSTLTKNS